MFPSADVLRCSILLCVLLSHVKHAVHARRFEIVLKAPGNTGERTPEPHKSVHVKYVPTSEERRRGTIVGLEPSIQLHQKAVEQLTVHLCDSLISSSIWYNEHDNICRGAPAMLIYEWTPYSSTGTFRTPEECGFEFNETRSIVLTIIYRMERRLHKEQSGVTLYISLQAPRCHMGTMLVGNKQEGTHFSCRSSNYPRLLYAVKNLNGMENKLSWRMHMLRTRMFGRKLVQTVVDSKTTSPSNQTNIEMVMSDVFLMKGSYLLIECENLAQANCYFLIYYAYKTQLMPDDDMCRSNSFANLFRLVPSREALAIEQASKQSFTIDITKIILVICVLLLVIWISIIIGCVIMRRVRGLVNFRTEPVSFFTSQKSKLAGGRTYANDTFQRAEADHVMNMEADHAGMTS